MISLATGSAEKVFLSASTCLDVTLRAFPSTVTPAWQVMIASKLLRWSPNRSGLLTTVLLLAAHALVWAVAAWLSRGNLDIPGDMVENFVWGREWQAGYAKHPPLFAWITAAWFAVFPRTDWAYFLLSSTNAALGLGGVATLARRFVPRDTGIVATLALAVAPLYTALAIKFNANAVLLSTWPWTACCFVAWMKDGRLRQAFGCGAWAALAMMGKYFSVVLLLGLVTVLLLRPAWRARLRGPAPWLAFAAFALVLSPHMAWLAQHGFATLGYAAQRSDGTLGAAALRYLNYCAAQVGYLLFSAGLLLFAVPAGQRGRAAATLATGSVSPRALPDLWWLTFAPLIVTGALALLAHTPMASVWGIAQWFALTTLWAALLQQAGIEISLRRTTTAVGVYWIVVIAGSTALGHVSASRGDALASEPRAELARAAEVLWMQRTGQPLRIVSGSAAEAGSIAFYAQGHVRWWSQEAPETTPWLSSSQVRKAGTLIVCAGSEGGCDAQARKHVAQPPEVVTVSKRSWGRVLAPRSYRLYLMLPQVAAL